MKKGKHDATGKRQGGAGKDPHVGRLLQNIYQQTVDEAVPAEMLDLLNKLD